MGHRYLHYQVIIPADIIEDSAEIHTGLRDDVQSRFGYGATVVPIPIPQQIAAHDEGTSFCTSLPDHTHWGQVKGKGDTR